MKYAFWKGPKTPQGYATGLFLYEHSGRHFAHILKGRVATESREPDQPFPYIDSLKNVQTLATWWHGESTNSLS